MGTDYVDLYQIHFWDKNTPIEESLDALNDVVKAGKARYIGASNLYAWQFATALDLSARNGWAKFATMQCHLNLIYREEEREMLPLCRARGIAVIPYSPLARGLLTRDWDEASARSGTDKITEKYYSATAEADRKVVEAVAQVAKKRNLPRAQIALAWVAQRPGVTAPIVGATKPKHLDDALAALDIRLSPEEIASMSAPYVPHEVVGPN